MKYLIFIVLFFFNSTTDKVKVEIFEKHGVKAVYWSSPLENVDYFEVQIYNSNKDEFQTVKKVYASFDCGICEYCYVTRSRVKKARIKAVLFDSTVFYSVSTKGITHLKT